MELRRPPSRCALRSGGRCEASAKQGRSRTGSVLVVALGFIAMLAVMAAGLRTALLTQTRLMRYREAQMQAMSWARAGVYLAMERLAEDGLGDDWTRSDEVAMPAGAIRIQIVDEERKLDLNTATMSALEHVLGDSELARAIVASRALRPIRRLEELWDLPEMSRWAEHQRVMLEQATVWPKAFRIRAVGLVDRPAVGYCIEAVVRRGGTAAQIVEWKEGGPASLKLRSGRRSEARSAKEDGPWSG